VEVPGMCRADRGVDCGPAARSDPRIAVAFSQPQSPDESDRVQFDDLPNAYLLRFLWANRPSGKGVTPAERERDLLGALRASAVANFCKDTGDFYATGWQPYAAGRSGTSAVSWPDTRAAICWSRSMPTKPTWWRPSPPTSEAAGPPWPRNFCPGNDNISPGNAGNTSAPRDARATSPARGARSICAPAAPPCGDNSGSVTTATNGRRNRPGVEPSAGASPCA